MWRIPLNSAVLAAPTHKGFGKVSNGGRHSSSGLDDQQMKGQDHLKGVYNGRDPLGGGDRKIWRERIVATRTEIASKSKRTIFKNHSHWTSPRKDFLT